MFKCFSVFKENFYMEQELNFTLQIILFVLTGLTGLAVLIFALRRKDNSFYNNKERAKLIELAESLDEQTEENLDILTKMNKQKDKIEEKIKAKKKILGLKLVD